MSGSVGLGSMIGPEQQYSSVVGVQAPVARTDMGASESAFASGLSNLTAFVGEGVDTYNRYQSAKGRSEAEAFETAGDNEYSAFANKLSDAVRSGQYSQSEATTRLSNKRNELAAKGVSAETLDKAEIRSGNTLLGQSLWEGSEEEQADEVFKVKFEKSGFFNPNHTKSERDAAEFEFQGAELEGARMAHEMRGLNLELKRAEVEGKDTEKLKADQVEQKQGSINKILVQAPTTLRNKASVLEAQYESDVQQLGEAEALTSYKRNLTQYVSEQRNKARTIASSLPDGAPVQLGHYNDFLTEFEENAITNIGTAELVKNSGEIFKRQQTTSWMNLYNSNADVRAMKLLEDNLKTASAGLDQSKITKIHNYLKTPEAMSIVNRKPGETAPKIADPVSFEVLEANLKSYANGTYKGDPESLDALVSGHIASLSEKMESGTTKQVDEALNYYASEDFSKFVKERGLTNADLDNAYEQLGPYQVKAAQSVQTFLQERIADEERKANVSNTGPRGRVAASKIATKDEFNIVWKANRVIVEGTTDRAKRVIAENGVKMTGPLTRIVNVAASLSGTTKEAAFADWMEGINGSDQEEPAVVPENAPAPVDYSGKEGMIGVDTEGRSFIIRNGVPVEVGGDNE